MRAPVRPPVPPMLARLARALPVDGFVYEPKWDGFRCVAFREGDEVDLRSRNDRPLARYFPELVEALRTLRADPIVLDGEIVIVGETGFDFEALMLRLHPAASRVERLRRETPASYIVFDVLALGDRDLLGEPFERRRAALEEALAEVAAPLFVTPATDDASVATEWLERFQGAGIDGVVAKDRGLRYQPGRRAMVKVKTEKTVECVVAGMRLFPGERVASLMLGLYDGPRLRHVGVSSSFPDAERRRLFEMLAPLAVPLEGHPWEEGYGLDPSPVGRLSGSAGRWTPDMEHDWVPLRAERVCEVAYDQLDGRRFRHTARFVRWRPDRDPESCTLDQLSVTPPTELGILPLDDRAPGETQRA